MVTPIGNVGSPWRAVVDGFGAVRLGAERWSLDWWVGAEDRWHLPSQDVAVRQHLVDHAPVVETRLRVPGGDVVQRAYATSAIGGGELVVVEVTNATPVPVAVALVLADGGARGVVPSERITQDRVVGAVSVDGRLALLLPRPPGRTAGGVLVFPLPHTASLRVGLPLDPTVPTALPPSLPTAEAVANGWRAHADRGLRLVLPDEGMTSSVATDRRALLLAADEPGAVAIVPFLSRYGYVEEAASALRRCFDPADVRAVAALAEHWRLHRDLALVQELAPGLREAPPPPPPPGRFGLLASVRNRLVGERRDGGLVLCSALPRSWQGRSLEVLDAPTGAGRLSYAVRWHGERPALLWELDRHPGTKRARLTAPGLCADWSSTDDRGEALLDRLGSVR